MKAINIIGLSVCAVLLLGVAGCESGKCDPCMSGCESWAGVYYGRMEGQSGSCADPSVLTGDVRITVTTNLGDPGDGGTDASSGGDTVMDSSLAIELSDNSGNWTVFQGDLCETEDSKEPYTYRFTVSYTETDGNMSLNNTISGHFTLSSDGLDSMEANYSVVKTSFDDPDDSCDMRATLDGTK